MRRSGKIFTNTEKYRKILRIKHFFVERRCSCFYETKDNIGNGLEAMDELRLNPGNVNRRKEEKE